MYAAISLGLGYLLGCISPAKMVSLRARVDLKQEGTTNLGATNTALVLGVRSGVLVMLLDILKGYLSVRLAKLLFPASAASPLVAGIGCVLGHCFPVFLKFRGGKGLASYGGMMLAYSPAIFMTILVLGAILMGLTNVAVVAPVLAGVLFPVLVALRTGSLSQTLLALAAGILLLGMHTDNIRRVLNGTETMTPRSFFREKRRKKAGG